MTNTEKLICPLCETEMIQHLGYNGQTASDDRIGWKCDVCTISIGTLYLKKNEWIVWKWGGQNYWDKDGFSSRDEAYRFLKLRAFE